MTYEFTFTSSCEKIIEKFTKKNSLLEKTIERKINEIIRNPHHYKPLRGILAGERRVHVLKSFVLKFTIDEPNKKIIFIFFGHHDKAY